jgi:hypothetical protein
MADTSSLYTTFKNTSGRDKYFGWLGKHGKRMLDGSSILSFGTPADVVQGKIGDSRRRQQALERDLMNGRIAILKTPPPIFFDLAPIAAVTNPTVAATTGTSVSAGGLPAGTYFVKYTWVNANGETTAGTSESSQFTSTGLAQLTTVTIPALPGNATSANIYLTQTNGATGTETLYRTGITTTTVQLTTAPPALAAPPGTNTATISAPALAATINVLGGGAVGGLLAAGTYFLKYTFIQATSTLPPTGSLLPGTQIGGTGVVITTVTGETTSAPESLQFTVAAGNIPLVNLAPIPSGCTGYNIYLTAANGGTGTEVLYMQNVKPDKPVLLSIAAPTSSTSVPGSNTALITNPTNAPYVYPTGIPTVNPGLALPGTTIAGVPTVTTGPTAVGGALQAGSYYAKFTYITANGETLPSPESAQFTISAGNVPWIIFPGSFLPQGATGLNLYLTPTNGASGTEVIYAGAASTGAVMPSITTPEPLTDLSNFAVRLIPAQGLISPPTVNTTYGHNIRTIRINADTLGDVDPSWGTYAGAL